MGLAHPYFLREPSIGPAQDEGNFKTLLGLDRTKHFRPGPGPGPFSALAGVGLQNVAASSPPLRTFLSKGTKGTKELKAKRTNEKDNCFVSSRQPEL